MIRILVTAMLIFSLQASEAQVRQTGAPRPALSGDRIYFVRTDGSDSNDCLSDRPEGACRTWQHAVDLVAALDINRFTVAIQHGVEAGPKTFTANTLIPPLVGGGLHIVGSPIPGNTIFNVPGNDCFTLYATVGSVAFDQMTLVGGSSGQINVTYNSIAIIGSHMIFGASSALAHVNVHDSLAMALFLSSNYTITGGSANAHIFVNGGMVFHERSAVTLTGTPDFPAAFIAATNGGKVQAAGSTFTGAATGPRYNVAGNAVISVFGGGIDYFPGSQPGTTSFGGQYIP